MKRIRVKPGTKNGKLLDVYLPERGRYLRLSGECVDQDAYIERRLACGDCVACDENTESKETL